MDSSVEYAIQTFSRLRPCGIYKQDYINDLFQRFGDMEDCIEVRRYVVLTSLRLRTSLVGKEEKTSRLTSLTFLHLVITIDPLLLVVNTLFNLYFLI